MKTWPSRLSLSLEVKNKSLGINSLLPAHFYRFTNFCVPRMAEMSVRKVSSSWWRCKKVLLAISTATGTKSSQKFAGKRQQRKIKHVGGGEQTNKTQQTETRVRGAPAFAMPHYGPVGLLSSSLSFQGCLTRTLNKNSTSGHTGPFKQPAARRNKRTAVTWPSTLLIASSCNGARMWWARRNKQDHLT